MSKRALGIRSWFFVLVPFAVAGTLAGTGCGLDDTVISAAVGGSDGGGGDATFDGSAGDSGGVDAGPGACASSPCENGGTCTDESDGGFSCACAAGYSGPTCATNIDDCVTADGGGPCLNGGTCVDGVAKYTCSCPAGYAGTNCETNVDDCASNPCAHGTCTDGVNTYTCTCTTGFAGANCDTCATDYYGYPTCTFCQAATTCSAHGTCSASGSCSCSTGFTGTSCNACATDYYNYPTCTFCSASTTCSGHGTCTSTGSCSCSSGYSGADCGTFSGTYSGSADMPHTNGPADTVPQYGQVNGTAAFSTNTANNRITPGVATTLTKLTFGPPTGTIGTRTWTATVMKNGATTALTCTIGSGGNTCNVTANVSLNNTDQINIQVVQDQNTNTARTAAWSIDYTQP